MFLQDPSYPDIIMNKYKILQYLELAYLILSVYSLFQASQDFNQMASDDMLSWRDEPIFRVQKIRFSKNLAVCKASLFTIITLMSRTSRFY